MHIIIETIDGIPSKPKLFNNVHVANHTFTQMINENDANTINHSDKNCTIAEAGSDYNVAIYKDVEVL